MLLQDILLTAIICFMVFTIILVYQIKRAKIVSAPTLPWVSKNVLAQLSPLLPPDFKGHIAELGSGWGSMTRALAKAYPQARIDGFEISWIPYLVSKLATSGFKNRIRIFDRDFFQEDLSSYQVVYCYLSPELMRDLKPRLEKCARGTLIISNAFPIPDWTPVTSSTTHIGVQIPVFCYRVGSA